MIHDWARLPPARDTLYVGLSYPWKPTRVILEYEGPQMVTLRRFDTQYLSVAVDEDDGVARWIETPVSDLEMESLVRRGSSVRMALEKNPVTMVEYSEADFRPLRAWEVNLRDLPESSLPKPGVFLPTSVRQRLAQEFGLGQSETEVTPAFRMGPESIGRAVAFGTVSALLDQLQKLWTALAGSIKIRRALLGVRGTAEGSLKIVVESDSLQNFNAVAVRYEDFTRATDDFPKLAAMLSAERSRVSAAYLSYLAMLDDHRAEVFAQWQDRSCFVAYGKSQRMRELGVPSIPPPAPAVTELTKTGRFLDFWGVERDSGFRFEDRETGAIYVGSIHESLEMRIAALRKGKAFGISLSNEPGAPVWTVTIEATEERGKLPKFVLLDYDLGDRY